MIGQWDDQGKGAQPVSISFFHENAHKGKSFGCRSRSIAFREKLVCCLHYPFRHSVANVILNGEAAQAQSSVLVEC